MLALVWTSAFKRDVKRAEKRGKDIERLRALLRILVQGEALPDRYRDHPLQGNWVGWRDAHIEPDWLLIYRVEGNDLRLGRTGTHADLFNE
jgi:mRNA interferase YafQ